ncbi:MAG TPA: hypothetical protein PKD53_04250 [Chloroflexaceae bacterium]|nr:hypothetical protein [Chloroflexaceae bacterium]
MGGELPHSSSQSTPLSHQDVADLLGAYVAATLEGRAPATLYPQVAAHLERCADCQAELNELLALTAATYDGEEPLPEHYPEPDLTGLRPAEPEQGGPLWAWRLDEAGQWLVVLTRGLLATGRPSLLVGAARADDLLYDLRVPPSAEGAPELRIEVFDQGGSLALRVSVDLAERDAFDMAGVEVMAAAPGAGAWSAVTDDVGAAMFRGIPRPALEGLHLGVRAGRSA